MADSPGGFEMLGWFACEDNCAWWVACLASRVIDGRPMRDIEGRIELGAVVERCRLETGGDTVAGERDEFGVASFVTCFGSR